MSADKPDAAMPDTTDTQDGSFHPAPKSEWALISQGAEARIWRVKMLKQLKASNHDDYNNIANGTSSTSHHHYIICKERFSKAYRHPELDARLTKSRCRSEARILEKCAGKGGGGGSGKTKMKRPDDSNSINDDDDDDDDNNNWIRVPEVLRISPPSLYLEYLDGPSVKAYLQEQQEQQDDDAVLSSPRFPIVSLEQLAHEMGELVGRLHNLGYVHGDLTTSNMMMLFRGADYGVQGGAADTVAKTNTNEDTTSNQNGVQSMSILSSSTAPAFTLCLIDFGLAKSTNSVEEQAVDLYVLERALESTHPHLDNHLFLEQVLKAYAETTSATTNGNGTAPPSKKTNQSTLDRLEQVRMRGRKRECFG